MAKRLIAKILIPIDVHVTGYDEYTIDINLLKAEFEDLDRSSSSDLINFGIYANRGSLEFIDVENLFEKLKQGIDGILVKFYTVKDDVSNLIKTFEIEDFGYNQDTQTLSVNLISSIMELQKIELPLIFLYSETKNIKLSELLAVINSHIPKEQHKINLAAGSTIANYIDIYCPYILPTNVWNLLSQICVFCGGRVYENPEGKIYLWSFFEDLSYPTITLNPNNILKLPTYNYNSEIKSKYFSPLSIAEKNRVKSNNASYDELTYSIYRETSNYEEEYTVYDGANNTQVTMERDSNYQDGTYRFIVTAKLTPEAKVFETKGVGTRAEVFLFARGVNYHERRENVSLQSNLISSTIDYDTNTISIKFNVIGKVDQYEYFAQATEYLKLFALNAKTLIYGSFFKDSDDIKTTFYIDGMGTDYYELPTNDLFQWRNEFTKSDGSKVQYTAQYLKLIHNELGKDTLELECHLSDYYKENSNDNKPYISNAQVIRRGMKVSPYIIRNGLKEPYSFGNNEYLVTGAKYSYQAILRQKLYLVSTSANI